MSRWTDPIERDTYYTAQRPAILGLRGMAATGHYLASAAAHEILLRGGNAIDAGVAAGLCINVVQPDMTSLGGVAPIMIYSARSGQIFTIDGLGVWPRAATVAFFRDRCGGDMPPGILRSVVPAAADAWITALELFGTMTFSQVASPALELAERGFAVYRFLHRNLIADLAEYQRWATTASMFLRGDSPLPIGTILVQEELAETLRRMMRAEAGATRRTDGLKAARAEFYQGETAERMVKFVRDEGGLIALGDLAQFHVRCEEPYHVCYRGYDVYACGPWCQGPVLLQALNLLESFDIASLDHNGPEYLHLVLESLKLAFADREAYYGDPRFVRVPIHGLLSKGYAAARRQRIDVTRACPEMPPAGDAAAFEDGAPGDMPGRASPAAVAAAHWEPDTSYLCVVDRWGNAISATPSDSAASGSLVPGVGCIISTRGSQSWLADGHPSMVAPGKRPRLTPSPAMVLHKGRFFMAFGTPGGDIQPQAMLQVLLNVVDFGMDLQTSVEKERVATHSFPNSFWPHTYTPGLVCLDPGHANGVSKRLVQLGHWVNHLTQWERHRRTGVCAIQVDPVSHVLTGAADSRRESYAIGW